MRKDRVCSVKELCVKELCVTKLHAREMCVCERIVCEREGARRGGGWKEAGRDTEPKTRTPHKEAGTKIWNQMISNDNACQNTTRTPLIYTATPPAGSSQAQICGSTYLSDTFSNALFVTVSKMLLV